MPIWLSDNRKNKNIARERVFSCIPKKSVLLLPGYRCECVKLALQKGIINENTTCTFVEKDKEIADQIERWVKDEWTLTVPPMIHRGELSSLEMHPIDLGYVDLFGNLTNLEMKWVQNQLIPNLMPGSDLAFTFSVQLRSNDFMKSALATIKTKYVDLYRSKMDNFKEINDLARPIAAFYDIIFGSLLSDHKYKKSFWTYKDGKVHTMLLIMFTNVKKTPEKLLRDYEQRKSVSTRTS